MLRIILSILLHGTISCILQKSREPVVRNLIFGGLGQDGRLLSELLISQNQKVTAVVRERDLTNEVPGVVYVVVDKISIEKYYAIISSYKPEIIYNLASMSSVAKCEGLPAISLELNFELVKNIVDAIKLFLSENNPYRIKLVQAGSSEMYGISEHPINESSVMHPKSKYGLHKKFAFDFLESIKGSIPNLYISNLILFNHESIFRPDYFVSQKIAYVAAARKSQKLTLIKFGNIDIGRDWGCAREYVEAIRLVGSQLSSENYVVSSGKIVRVREILSHALNYVGHSDYDLHSFIDLAFFRQVETAPLVGDASKIGQSLGWKANRSIYSVIEDMIDFQIRELRV